MKKNCVFLWAVVMLLIPIVLYAEDSKANSLFDLQVDHGGFCEVSVKSEKIEDDAGMAFELRGGWIINHNFYLGVGCSLALRDMVDFYQINWSMPQNIIIGYAGPQIGVLIYPSELVNFDISMLIGYGGVGYSYSHSMIGDGFMVYEPAVGINVGLFDFLKICFSVSYLICDGILMPRADSGEFSGFCFKLGTKIGKF